MAEALTFQDLQFSERRGLPGVHATTFFPNGYGASVVKGFGTYGGDRGLYELAVIKGDAGDWSLCYDTPITDDVLGYLSEEAVAAHLGEIAGLPSVKVGA